ncbi:MAG: M23 family metallopeptidase [Lachnospiraceae bacterium]|nr:M23 family metallopeptidase [Lachnospiraceae bacterium]
MTGEVLLKYSMDKTVYFQTLAQYKYNPGILIRAEAGTEVKAAADGKVTAVSEDDDHGTVIQMDLGNDYMVTYGQVTDVKVKAGDEVKEGDVIAKVSEPTKYFSEEGTHLYFQVNQGKNTVDPMLLLR